MAHPSLPGSVKARGSQRNLEPHLPDYSDSAFHKSKSPMALLIFNVSPRNRPQRATLYSCPTPQAQRTLFFKFLISLLECNFVNLR